MQTTRTPYSISFMATVLLLLLFACHSTVANAAVALGATRVIYPANQKQVLLPVTNNDPASVYLIQSWIENAGDQKDTQFVITPPLFSMQGKKENTLRIINATNHQHRLAPVVTVLLIIVGLTVIRISVTVGVVTAARFITE